MIPVSSRRTSRKKPSDLAIGDGSAARSLLNLYSDERFLLLLRSQTAAAAVIPQHGADGRGQCAQKWVVS